MKRLGLLLCALLVGGALSTTGAAAQGWGWHHGWHEWHPPHSAGGPIRSGPRCWTDTDFRGFGYYRWCDGRRPAWRGHHHRRWHRWHRW
jgi:hypothetical protein